MSFDPSSGTFSLTYTPNPAIKAPTVIFVPVSEHYPGGYCARVAGGRVTSRADSTKLNVVDNPGATAVTVSVTAGRC